MTIFDRPKDSCFRVRYPRCIDLRELSLRKHFSALKLSGNAVFEFLKTIVNIQVKDIEAKLLPTAECLYGGKGEVELEAFSAGNTCVEAEIKYCGVPDGTPVDVTVGGNRIATLVVQGGRAKEYLKFSEHDNVPQAEVGDTAEMAINGQVCYRGTFYRD